MSKLPSNQYACSIRRKTIKKGIRNQKALQGFAEAQRIMFLQVYQELENNDVEIE